MARIFSTPFADELHRWSMGLTADHDTPTATLDQIELNTNVWTPVGVTTDITTTWSVTIARDGKYFISAVGGMDSNVAGSALQSLELHKNGTVIPSTGTILLSAYTNPQCKGGTWYEDLVAGDVLKLYGRGDTGDLLIRYYATADEFPAFSFTGIRVGD